ncbi:MAG: metallophosphoesterase [Thermoguttaceae bacterium]|nr:metallophosphoesterase [Thermoguttaceae bacterium]
MIRFAVIADVQYGNLDILGARNYRESIPKFLRAVGEIASEQALFTLQLGDASQSDWENHLAMKELFDVAEKAGISWKHVLGNHDFLVADEKKRDLYPDLSLEKPGYYDFVVNDPEDDSNVWRFVVLNGNEISSYAAETTAEREKAKEERNRWKLADGNLPADWNGSVSQQQLQWLESRLKLAAKQKEKALVCSHFPLFANSKSLDSDRTRLASLLDVGIYYFNLGVSTWNGKQILDILDKYPCVKGYLAGHLHEGSYGVRKNVAHITFKGIVETIPNAFAFVKLTSNSIIVEGKEAQPSYEFHFK